MYIEKIIIAHLGRKEVFMQNTIKIVNEVVQKTFNDFCEEICSPKYYTNKFLAHTINTNDSLQCICREYARFLYAASNICNNHQFDLFHANLVLTFLQNYTDNKKQKYIINLIDKFLDDLEENNDFLILFCKGRGKGFRSVEAKTQYKFIMPKVLASINENFENIEAFKNFTEKNLKTAINYLNKLSEDIEKKDPLKDFYGFRLIVDQCGKNCSEEDRINFCYELEGELISFFENRGFKVFEQKDYIAKPKPRSGYQSLHVTVLILGTPVEFQIRTSSMDYEAEYGKSNHELIYKDNNLQTFLKEFLYSLSQNSSRISNENNGLLECVTLIDRVISKVTDSEIPETPEDLKPVDFELLEKLIAS